MDYLFAVLAATLLAFEFSFSKKYQSAEGTSVVAALRFNMFSGLLSALIMFGFAGFRLVSLRPQLSDKFC